MQLACMMISIGASAIFHVARKEAEFRFQATYLSENRVKLQRFNRIIGKQ